ncbi:unnamed protein product, partial [Mesorhabditis spiculigera]
MPSPCGCGRKKRSVLLVKSSTADQTCNSPAAQAILAKHLDTLEDYTKVADITAPLHSELAARTNGRWLVLCGPNTDVPAAWRGDATQFCSVTHKRTTCHAFQIE